MHLHIMMCLIFEPMGLVFWETGPQSRGQTSAFQKSCEDQMKKETSNVSFHVTKWTMTSIGTTVCSKIPRELGEGGCFLQTLWYREASWRELERNFESKRVLSGLSWPSTAHRMVWAKTVVWWQVGGGHSWAWDMVELEVIFIPNLWL